MHANGYAADIICTVAMHSEEGSAASEPGVDPVLIHSQWAPQSNLQVMNASHVENMQWMCRRGRHHLLLQLRVATEFWAQQAKMELESRPGVGIAGRGGEGEGFSGQWPDL